MESQVSIFAFSCNLVSKKSFFYWLRTGSFNYGNKLLPIQEVFLCIPLSLSG